MPAENKKFVLYKVLSDMAVIIEDNENISEAGSQSSGKKKKPKQVKKQVKGVSEDS